MKRQITFNKSILGLVAGILVCFIIVMGSVLMRSLQEMDKEYKRNLQFRSNIFRESIKSSVVMGDYAEVLEKAQSFIKQSDVITVKIDLLNGERLVDLNNSLNASPHHDIFDVEDSIEISDESSAVESVYPVSNVKIRFDLMNLRNIFSGFIIQALIVSGLFLATALVLVMYFSRLFNVPLKQLSAVALFGDLARISQLRATSRIKEVNSLENAIQKMAIELIELNEKEKENFKNAAVGRVIAHISHDLRAPLAVVERLLAVPDKELSAMRGAVRESLNRLYSMIESLRHSEVENMITKSLSTLSFKFGFDSLHSIAEKRNIELLAPAEDIPFVRMDSIKVERAWMNLASNAIDFARSKVVIEAATMGQDLILRVVDDGNGVPAEFLPKLFQRGATHGKADGTGLGLAYVRQIMRGHGGDVAYRRENNLTIFECRLPNAVEPEKEQVVENTASLEIKLEQKLVRTVAICLEPETLSQLILAELASYKSGDFFFTGEREGANIVVSNIEDIMFEVLERDDQEFVGVANLKGDKRAIATVLTRKFNLEPKGTIRV